MKIIRKSRGTVLPKQAQKVFLCYNGCDTAGRDEIVSDLLSMDAGIDCVVSYIKNPDAAIDENHLQNEFSGTQLFVIWVTLEMLQSTSTQKLPTEYRIAQELHIPILPILNDDGLFPLYNKKFGSIHCIAKLDKEYRTKLKAQIEMFLATDEIIKQVREKAFTATVFVSYRRDDLSEVRNFMKAFHHIEGFESISTWYDNYLISGRNFNKDIKKIINKSNALVIIVTPRKIGRAHV